MDSGKLLAGKNNSDIAERGVEILPPGYYGNSSWTSAEPSVGQYWRILLKRKWTIFGAVVIVTTMATIASLRMTPIYEASGRIAMNPQNAEFLGFKSTPESNSQTDV